MRRSRTRSRRSRARAGPPTPSCTCSRSRARSASPLDMDDFDRISRAGAAARRPQAWRAVTWRPTCIAPAEFRSSRKRLLEAGLLHADARTVSGRTIGEEAAAAVETPAQEVVRPLSNPLKATGGLVILRGSLAPEGCVVKVAGHDRLHHRGPARVFDSEQAALSRGARQPDSAERRRGHSLRGSCRQPGHAGDARR